MSVQDHDFFTDTESLPKISINSDAEIALLECYLEWGIVVPPYMMELKNGSREPVMLYGATCSAV